MISAKRFLLGVSLLILLVQPVMAQRRPGGQGGFRGRGGPGGFGNPTMLLQNEGVQKELKLSEDQIQKIKDVSEKTREKYREQFESLRSSSSDQSEQREKMQALFRTASEETAKELAGILKPEQDKRLKQIGLQQRGVQAFQDPEVEKELKLTDDQKESIRTIAQDAAQEMREAFQGAQGNFQELREKGAALRKESMNKAMAVLTDEQKKTWKSLTGEPFELRFQGGGPGGARRRQRDQSQQ